MYVDLWACGGLALQILTFGRVRVAASQLIFRNNLSQSEDYSETLAQAMANKSFDYPYRAAWKPQNHRNRRHSQSQSQSDRNQSGATVAAFAWPKLSSGAYICRQLWIHSADVCVHRTTKVAAVPKYSPV